MALLGKQHHLLIHSARFALTLQLAHIESRHGRSARPDLHISHAASFYFIFLK